MSHLPSSEFQMPVVQDTLQPELKWPNAETLDALKQSEDALSYLRAGGNRRFDTLSDYFCAMQNKIADSKLPAKSID